MEAGDDVKLILGFETEELAGKMDDTWCDLGRREDGCDFWAHFEYGRKNRIWTWECRTGDCTVGTQALVAKVRRGPRLMAVRRTPFQRRYYPILRQASDASVILNTFQWLSHAGEALRDWSGYDLMWVDFRSSRPLQVWLTVEDELIEPPVVRIFKVPAGKWVTLELDLRAAERTRGLDLTQITNFHLLGRARKAATVRVDNVRLVRRGTGSRLDVLRDNVPMTSPKPKCPAKPKVPKLSTRYRPDRSRVELEPSRVIVDGTLVPFGWIAAADNRHMILGFTRGEGRWDQRVFVKQSTDGGRRWTALPKPRARNFDHGTSRGSVVDANGDAVTLSSGVGCAGPGIATPRQTMTRYTFTGLGYERRRWPSILDYDIRHCGSAVSVVRLPRGAKKGRLWASWGSVDRRRRLVVHGKFSDDDGETWWHTGKSAMVPGSANAPFSLNSYSYQQPRVTYFRGHAAVFWQDAKGLRWSRFDGERWSEAEGIEAEAKAVLAVSENESFRVPGSVVTVGEDEVFLTAWGRHGVFRYDGKAWHRELTDADDAGSLTVCGGKDVMLITMGSTEQPPEHKRIWVKREAKVQCYRRRRDGTWAPPLDLAGGKVTLHEYRQMTAVVVPPASPPNFAPVAFSDGETITMVKVPVPGK
ncbi:MAG TPA: sialidase family protein [Planctomycetota bacterium]|nr:sialidase family protein [Planctomycetota bacterium]